MDAASIQQLHAQMNEYARHLRFALNPPAATAHGNTLGKGAGHSTEFHDHRSYSPGDDPRHIDWQAYARTDLYTVKLFRKESTPRIDLVIDTSRSMLFEPARRKRVYELLYFAIESAAQSGVSLKVHFVGHSAIHTPAVAELRAYRLPLADDDAPALAAAAAEDATPDLGLVPWRMGALRVFISDLLFAGAPETWLKQLAVSQAHSVLFCPFLPEEADPAWHGQIEFIDCEMGTKQRQLVLPAVLEKYKQAYIHHFSLWREAATRSGVTFVRIDARSPFLAALEPEAVPSGAIVHTT